MKAFKKILEMIKKIVLPARNDLTWEGFEELERKKNYRRGDYYE